MTKVLSYPTPFSVIHQLFSEEFCRTIFREAIDKRKLLSDEARQALHQILDSLPERLPGMRKTSKASPSTLLNISLKWAAGKPPIGPMVTDFMVSAWRDTSELSQQVQHTLDTLRLEAPPIEDTGYLSYVMTQADFERIWRQVIAQHPTSDVDMIRLAIMLHLQCAPVEDSKYQHLLPNAEQISLTAASLWHAWLEDAQSEPPESNLWDTLDEFVARLQELAMEKRQQRPQFRQQLDERIAQLVSQGSEYLSYFDALCVQSWSTTFISEAAAGVILPDLEQLIENMELYRALEGRTDGTFTERQERRNRVNELVQEIISQRDALNEKLHLPNPDEGLSVASVEEIVEEAPETSETEAPVQGEEAQPIWESIPEPEPAPAEVPSFIPESAPLATITRQITFNEDDTLPFTPVPLVETALPSGAEQAITMAVATLQDSFVPAEPDPTLHIEMPPALDILYAARLWQESPTQEHGNMLLWNMIALGDWAGAYWLSQSLRDTQDMKVDLSADFCAVMASVMQLTPNTLLLHHEINEKIGPLEHPLHIQLLSMGAALRGALVAPENAFYSWLQPSKIVPSLHSIVAAVKDFSQYGVALDDQLLIGVSGAETRVHQREKVVREAKRLIEVGPQQTMSYQPATQVWRHLMAPNKGELRELLTIVATDNARQSARAHDLLKKWTDERQKEREIKAIDQHLRGKRPAIAWGSLRRLHELISEVCGVAQDWYHRTQLEEEIEKRGNWLFSHIEGLRKEIRTTIDRVYSELEGYLTDVNGLPSQAAAYGFARQIASLLKTLKLDLGRWSAFETAHPWQAPFESDPHLERLMGQRLLWACPLPLNFETLKPDAAQLAAVPGALSQSYIEGNSISAVISRWLATEDYRFIPMLLNRVDSEAEGESLKQRYDEMLEESRYGLRQKHDDALVRIEQAIVDGIISDDERSGYSARHEVVKPNETIYFQPEKARLESIRTDLEAARRKRLGDLRDKWQENRIAWMRGVDADLWARIEKTVLGSFDQNDTRVIEEYIDQVRHLDPSSDSPFAFERREGRAAEIFREMWEQSEALEDALGSRGIVPNGGMTNLERIKDYSTFAGMTVANLSSTGQSRVRDVAQAWKRLKQMENRQSDQEVFTHLKVLLSFLEFTLADTGLLYPFEVVQRDKEVWHVRAQMEANEDLVRPIPQFGSQARGRHDILCVWERPQADGLSAQLFGRRLDANSMIVFYFGRMSRQRRQQFMRNARDKGLAAIVVDEILLAYIAVKFLQQKQSPLPTLMQCALLFAYVQPYTPGQAGNVPPEMFFGRADMARDLQQPETCIVYGGRQLGKSALLRHVQRRFHAPNQGRYAHVEDIKPIGDPSSGITTESLWRKLRDCFKSMGLLKSSIVTEHTDDIIRHIDSVFQARADVRVIILLDEADNFLEADAEKNFYVVDQLRIMMNKTNRRFKVVFAGLHNVQRFQGMPNQPLAHFGKPLSVGPLEASEALRLVQQPFEILGFQIDNPTALRILSYTNYHPGLIQIFCAELLRTLYRKPRQDALPYIVTRSDVEAVYLKADVRNSIRERFTWTLALDTRYQAVAWAMIENQLHIRDSYSKEYNASQIMDLVRMWWPQGFEGTEMKPLLDEMKGLGLLAEQEGRYRLRSPNLVRLMGEENVEQSLLELAEVPGQQRRLNSDHHHSLLDMAKEIYSPLTIAQERALNMPNSGVALFAISPTATADMMTVLRRLIPANLDEREKDIRELKFPSDKLTLRRSIENAISSHRGANHYVLFCQCSSDASPALLADLVSDSMDWMRKSQHARQKQIRLIFILDTMSAWQWIQINPKRRQQLEQGLDAFVVTKPWTEIGIKQWLDRLEARTPVRAIAQATGGWHCLVEQVFQESLLPAMAAHQQHPRTFDVLATEAQQDAFRLKLGLSQLPSSEAVLHFLCSLSKEGEWLSRELLSLMDEPAEAQTALELLLLLHYVEYDLQDDQKLRINPIIYRLYV